MTLPGGQAVTGATPVIEQGMDAFPRSPLGSPV